MAVSHIAFDDQAKHGRLLRRALQQIEEGKDNLDDTIAAMALMIDGDGSQAAHFTYMTTKFGFASDAASKAAWEELNSLKFKLSTNDSVTDVAAALAQAFAKFR